MDVAAPAVTQINTLFSSDVDQLCSVISDLKLLFKSMHLPKPSFNHCLSKSPHRSSSSAPRKTQPPSNLCWYHHCFGDDKQTSQSLMATSAPGNHNSCLFFTHGHTLNTRFLVNTGAEVSVCPLSWLDRQRKSSNLTLQSANNTSISHLRYQADCT